MGKENPDPQPGANKQKHPVVFVTPITIKVARVTLWTHHTQLKETIDMTDESSLGPPTPKDKTNVGPRIMVVLLCLFCLPMGKDSIPINQNLGWKSK